MDKLTPLDDKANICRRLVMRQVTECGHRPFVQHYPKCESLVLEGCRLKMSFEDGALFSSRESLRELTIKNCTWSNQHSDRQPIRIEELLLLLGPDSQVEKLNICLIDEKTKNYQQLFQALKNLKQVDISFPLD